MYIMRLGSFEIWSDSVEEENFWFASLKIQLNCIEENQAKDSKIDEQHLFGCKIRIILPREIGKSSTQWAKVSAYWDTSLYLNSLEDFS